jgi:hypothetical protein
MFTDFAEHLNRTHVSEAGENQLPSFGGLTISRPSQAYSQVNTASTYGNIGFYSIASLLSRYPLFTSVRREA